MCQYIASTKLKWVKEGEENSVDEVMKVAHEFVGAMQVPNIGQMCRHDQDSTFALWEALKILDYMGIVSKWQTILPRSFWKFWPDLGGIYFAVFWPCQSGCAVEIKF